MFPDTACYSQLKILLPLNTQLQLNFTPFSIIKISDFPIFTHLRIERIKPYILLIWKYPQMWLSLPESKSRTRVYDVNCQQYFTPQLKITGEFRVIMNSNINTRNKVLSAHLKARFRHLCLLMFVAL